MKQHIYTLVLMAFFLSANAQIKWTTAANIASSSYSNSHPRITHDRAGNPLVIWGRMSDESVFFSRWTGTMFTTPVKLNGTLSIATASWMGPDIASHGDTIYVVMKETPESSTSSHIYQVKSFNGGASFSAPSRIENIGDSVSRFPTITTNATGNPIIAFMKFNKSFLESRWVATKSNDYGNTFSIDKKTSGWGNSSEVCDCCPGAIVSEGSNCAVLYRDNNANIRDNWTGISTDGGASYKTGFALENNNWMLNSCPASGPDGVMIGDTLYSTFMNGGSGNYRNYFSKSAISTGAILSITTLTGTIAGLSQQNFPRIASDGNAMAIVWKQIVSNEAQLPILFTNNISKGFPTSYDTVDLASITNADVSLSKGNIFVIWEDNSSGTVKCRFGNYADASASINEVYSTNFAIFPNPTANELNIFSSDNKNFTLNLFNSLGENIFTSPIQSNLILDTSIFAGGLYIIQLSLDNKLLATKKIIINNN